MPPSAPHLRRDLVLWMVALRRITVLAGLSVAVLEKLLLPDELALAPMLVVALAVCIYNEVGGRLLRVDQPGRLAAVVNAQVALDTLSLVQRELNPWLTVAGMLLTMHDGRTRLAQDVEREVREHFPELVFDTVIPRNVRIGEAPSFGKPVIHHDPHCAGADAYFELAKEVAARG